MGTAYFELTPRWADAWPVMRRLVFGSIGGMLDKRPGVAFSDDPVRRRQKIAAVEVTFDPDVIRYERLVELFYLESCHPTRQPNFRHHMLGSRLLVCTDEEQALAESVRDRVFVELRQAASPQTSVFYATPVERRWPVVRITKFEADASCDVESLPASFESDGKSHDAALEELRSLAAETGGCFDDSPDGPNSHHLPFVDQVDAQLLFEAGPIRRLSASLRAWLDERRSAGLADGQLDVRGVELGIDTVSATSFLRASRTDTAFRFECNLWPGNTTRRDYCTYGARRVHTDLDAHGTLTETIEPISAGRSPVAAKPAPWSPLELVDPNAAGTWYEHIPAAEMLCGCDTRGDQHVVRWEAGHIKLGCIEGEDDELERVLFLLSRDPCRCWLVRALWNPRFMLQRCMPMPGDDMFIVVNWRVAVRSTSRARVFGTRPILTSGPPQLQSLNAPLDKPIGRPATQSAKQAVIDHIYQPIFQFNVDFYTRWVLTNLAWMTEHHDRLGTDDRTYYASLVFQHFEPPLLEALWTPPRADPLVRAVAIHLRLVGVDERAGATGSVDDDLVRIDAGVSFHWITRVWVRGLAIASNHLVLDADGPADAKVVDVVVASWDRESDHSAGAVLVTRQARARRYKAGWRLV